LGGWSESSSKRLFDCACVVAILPLLIPILMVIALAVWLTSDGPVLFLQKRVGRDGRLFTIAKFRTLTASAGMKQPFTTATNQRFTPIGVLLRRWKLDELPQLGNVLRGDMSLVGPRPKVRELTLSNFPCRPGITGAATLVFAREEAVLDRVPVERLQECYHSVVLPAKERMDAEYMERATFASDLRVLVETVLRRWDSSTMEALLGTEIQDAEARVRLREAALAGQDAKGMGRTVETADVAAY
jgi:lipopolysaccharide/colanic/teichoic acid biosynthesis glycosyltransferase